MLSPKVKESLKEAESSIRNALYWASKNEKPFTCKQITEILHATEVIEHPENLLDKLENRKSGDSGMFGNMFG